MKKLSLVLVLTVLGLAFATSQASAFSLAGGYSGPVEFKLAGFTASIDPTYQPPAGFDTTYLRPIPGTNLFGETWGIFRVTSVEKPNAGGGLWTPLSSGEEIYAMIYGLYDWHYAASGTDWKVSQVGGFFDLYLDTNPSAGDFNVNLGTGGRTAVNAYNTVTNTGSTLFLSGAFSAGVQNPEPGGPGGAYTTVLQTVGSIVSPTTGSGSGFGDLITGSHFGMFNTQSRVDAYGVMHDVEFRFDIDRTSVADWDQYVNDPMFTATPEPTSMLLFGIGIVGLATLKRKKKVA